MNAMPPRDSFAEVAATSATVVQEPPVRRQQQQACRYGGCETTRTEAERQQRLPHGGGLGLRL